MLILVIHEKEDLFSPVVSMKKFDSIDEIRNHLSDIHNIGSVKITEKNEYSPFCSNCKTHYIINALKTHEIFEF